MYGSGVCAAVLPVLRSCGLLASGLLDDLFRDVPRHLGVRVELHAVASTTLSLAAEISDVAEHLRERDRRGDDAGAVALVHREDLAATGVDVTDDVTEEVLGGDDLDGHQRLHEDGVRAARGVLEGHRAGDLEGQLGGVDVVVLAVGEGDLDVDHRVAGDDAELHGLLATGVDRGDVLARDATTGDLVHELVAAATVGVDARGRLDVDDDAGVLAGAAGLLLVGVLDLVDGLADRLAVRDLRLADVGLDVDLAAHAVDEDVEVQLAHAGDDGLAGLLVGADLEGRVLLGEALDRGAQLLLVALGLG